MLCLVTPPYKLPYPTYWPVVSRYLSVGSEPRAGCRSTDVLPDLDFSIGNLLFYIILSVVWLGTITLFLEQISFLLGGVGVTACLCGLCRLFTSLVLSGLLTSQSFEYVNGFNYCIHVYFFNLFSCILSSFHY